MEIDKKALEHNLKEFLKLISPKTRFMAVIKSNAYGHGLTQVAKLLASYQLPVTSNQRLWFGVDSIVEGLRLRREGLKTPILVLGSTLPSRVGEAAENDIILTISNFESLTSLIRANRRTAFHIKIDTGMHRQGFLPMDVPKLIKLLKSFKLSPQGIYTHFASKDWGYPTYTQMQFSEFGKVLKKFQQAGFKNLLRHAAASDAAILFPETRLDMVRVGMGLYGYWPSLVAASKHPAGMTLRPVLSWKTVVGEVKEIPAGSQMGYDITERVTRKTKTAVLPIGYWHGYDRGLSTVGEVLIRGRRAKILGRVSMDMIVVDITDIDYKLKSPRTRTSSVRGRRQSKVKVGDEAVLIGRQMREKIEADELGLKIGTTQYEFLTRINPLIKRIVR